MASVLSWYVLPAVYLLASMLALSVRTRIWTIAQGAALVGMGSALYAVLDALWRGHGGLETVDPVGLVMATLVAVLGWVIIRYSRRYLEGESGQVRYVVALLFTLCSVHTLVATHDLGVLVVGWSASSLGLHHLLTFHRHQAPAQIVAHKNHLVSRMAEICLVVALALLFRIAHTLDLGGIAGYVHSIGTLSTGMQLAAVLIAFAAILKSAQLPMHGWLIQVMEAPTPVSALLHAGIVNIGGFVLIRLAVLVAAAPLARWLLVVVGSLTAVLAGLVMMTRISVKVRLAWSTCAQMGFMLMECGLGLYDLAMLHLVAHSLYKGYAFLAAGETVLEARRHDLVPKTPPQSPNRTLLVRLVSLPVALTLVAASTMLWKAYMPTMEVPVVALAIVGLGLAPLLWGSPAEGLKALGRGTLRVLGLMQLYMVWHVGFTRLVPSVTEPSLGLALWVGGCFLSLYVVQIWLLAYPHGRLSTNLYPWVYGGFYFDERFTRLTFRLWPARVSVPHHTVQPKLRPSIKNEQA